MLFLTGSSVPTGPAWAQASPGRRVLVRWLPAAVVGIVQAAVIIGVVAVSGVSISSPLGLVAISILGAAAFAATNQALVAAFGGIGRMVSIAFLAVQAAAFGGLVPIETAPAMLQTLNGILPLPQFVAGAGRFLLGGGGDVLGPCLTLVGWTVAACWCRSCSRRAVAPSWPWRRARSPLRRPSRWRRSRPELSESLDAARRGGAP
jgi:putative membrane protein